MRAMLTTGLILLAMAHPAVRADATLNYRLTQQEGEQAALRIALARFFARIESSAAPDGWWLFQAGKFFPLYRVDDKRETWTLLTPEVQPRLGPLSRTKSPGGAAATGAEVSDGPAPAPEAEQAAHAVPEQGEAAGAAQEAAAGAADAQTAAAPKETPAPDPAPARARAADVPRFAPTEQMDEVAGVRCRVVNELRDGEPAIEHCMANETALGITEREIRTLARTFAMARAQGLDWLGTATADEEFVSVRSRALDGGAALMLESVSTGALPPGHLRVPRQYRKVPRQTDPASAPVAVPPPGDAAQPDAGATQ
jgi:hypothetical protein